MNKSITTNDQVKNLVQIRKSLSRGKAGNLAENQAFIDFLTIQQQMTAEFEETWAVIKDQMEAHDITKISGEWGYITMAERKNWTATKQLPARFYKQVLDSSKLTLLNKAGEKLPKGVVLSTTRFLQKKINVGV